MRKLILSGLCVATVLMFAGCCCSKQGHRSVEQYHGKASVAVKKSPKKAAGKAEKKAAEKAAQKAAAKGAKKIR